MVQALQFRDFLAFAVDRQGAGDQERGEDGRADGISGYLSITLSGLCRMSAGVSEKGSANNELRKRLV